MPKVAKLINKKTAGGQFDAPEVQSTCMNKISDHKLVAVVAQIDYIRNHGWPIVLRRSGCQEIRRSLAGIRVKQKRDNVWDANEGNTTGEQQTRCLKELHR